MTRLPHVLKRIRLNLARSKEFPDGLGRHGYEFVAPLDADGHIDPSCGGNIASIAACAGSGRRRRRDRPPRAQAGRRGACALGVRLRRDRRRTTTRPAIASATTPSRTGEYVSIRDEDGEMHTFQVVSVEPAT